MSIHPTAIVEPGAVIPASCTVGPYCTIGPEVVLGEENELTSHIVMTGRTTLGRGNRVSSFTTIGIAPQDLKYKGEPTGVSVGDNNSIREFVTISRGTEGGGGVTRIGSDCLLMAYVHVGHDSSVGNNCILSNAATLAGHVTVEDFSSVGAFSAVHQFCRVGRYAFIGGGTMATQDVLPYSLTSATRENHAYSINKVGLERRGFTPEQIKELRKAYRTLLASKKNTSQALEALHEQLANGTPDEHVRYLVDFVEASKRGFIK